jgi:hypothetical protein
MGPPKNQANQKLMIMGRSWPKFFTDAPPLSRRPGPPRPLTPVLGRDEQKPVSRMLKNKIFPEWCRFATLANINNAKFIQGTQE